MAAKSGGKFDVGYSGDLAWRMGDDTWIFYFGSFRHFAYSTDGMLDYRECDHWMRNTDGNRLQIVGTGTFCAWFRSAGGVVPLVLLIVNVAHVPDLMHHLSSPRLVADAGHKYSGIVTGITIALTTGAPVFAPSIGKLSYLDAFRSGPHADE